MSKKKSSNESSEGKSSDISIALINQLGLLMTKVGIPGFCAIMMSFYIFCFLDQEKKDELTDAWLLFKNDGSGMNAAIVIFFLVMLFFIQWYFYHQALRQKDVRICEIVEERNKLQEILLKRSLDSSTKK